jgi:hypothetical protein
MHMLQNKGIVHQVGNKNKFRYNECHVTHTVHIPATHQPTNALNKIQFMTSIYLLHVSAAGCHPQVILIGYNAISRDSSQSLQINFGTTRLTK